MLCLISGVPRPIPARGADFSDGIISGGIGQPIWSIIREGSVLVTIQITKPEIEALIEQRLRSGAFKDAEDVILQALQSMRAINIRPLGTLDS